MEQNKEYAIPRINRKDFFLSVATRKWCPTSLLNWDHSQLVSISPPAGRALFQSSAFLLQQVRGYLN